MAVYGRFLSAIGRLTSLVLALGTCCWLVFSHQANANASVNQPIPSDANLGQLVQNRELVAFGQSVFEDKNLSFKRNMSCATCHSVKAGGTAASDIGNRLVGVHAGSSFQGFDKPPSRDNAMGFRNVQTSTYAAFSPPLGRVLQDNTVVFEGGNFWDGRATGFFTGRSSQEQATQPPIGTLEGQLPSPACLVYRVLNPSDPKSYPTEYTAVFGGNIKRVVWPSDIESQCATANGSVSFMSKGRNFTSNSQVQLAYNNIALALMAYEGSQAMSPFNSKYDQVLQGKAQLTSSEKRGMDLFNGKAKCASCHVSTTNAKGIRPLFTDFTYDNLGIPRNPANPIYHSAWINKKGQAWVDLGLGGFLQTQDTYRDDAIGQMGKFKVPTVRNVARKPNDDFVRSYMHNGYFKSLEQVVDFYNSRDTKPRCKNPLTPVEAAMEQGCWPEPEYPETVNTAELGNLQLSKTDEADLVSFMKTLSDQLN